MAKKTVSALEMLDRRYFRGNPEAQEALQEARESARVSREIYQLRKGAGLTQAQLAEKVGTTASVICRLEDDDYEGHSLPMLRRIASALGQDVHVQFTPKQSGSVTGGVERGSGTASDLDSTEGSLAGSSPDLGGATAKIVTSRDDRLQPA